MCQSVFHETDVWIKQIMCHKKDSCAKQCFVRETHVPNMYVLRQMHMCQRQYVTWDLCVQSVLLGRHLWQIFMVMRQKHMCQSQYASRDRDTCAKDNRHPDTNKGCPQTGLTSLSTIHPTVISRAVVLQTDVITPITKSLSASNTTEYQHPHETQHHTRQLHTPVYNETPCPLFHVVLSCLLFPLNISLTSY
jgi:hypothetical protein